MKFNMTNPNPATRFPFNDDDGGFVELRPVTPAVLESLHRKFTKTRPEYHRGVRHDVTTTDQDGYDAAFWDYCIAGWDGVFDEHGEPIECTRENKVFLYKNSPEFAALVRVCIDRLAEDMDARTQALEKNFSTTSQAS